MTLLPRKTSFRWKGISSLQAPKKGERKKRKEQKSKKKERKVERERKKERAEVVESGVTYVREERRRRENTHFYIYTCTSSFCENEDTSRLLPDTYVRIQHLLPSQSSERLHGVCSDWAGDFSPCDERRRMSLRFEVISLFLEWSCLSVTWIYYRNCFALVNWSHSFNSIESYSSTNL